MLGVRHVPFDSRACFVGFGANVTCVDVEADRIGRLKRGEIPEAPYAVAEDADTILTISEWNAYSDLDPKAVRQSVRGGVLSDHRTIYELDDRCRWVYDYTGVDR